MKKEWVPPVISAFVLILSCGQDNPLAFAQQDLLGVWNVSQDEFTNKNNVFETFDQLSAADTDSILFTFNGDGTFDTQLLSMPEGFLSFTINYRLSADTLYWAFGGLEIPYQYKFERTFDGNSSTLTNDSTFYDFNDDNVFEPATEVIELIKQRDSYPRPVHIFLLRLT